MRQGRLAQRRVAPGRHVPESLQERDPAGTARRGQPHGQAAVVPALVLQRAGALSLVLGSVAPSLAPTQRTERSAPGGTHRVLDLARVLACGFSAPRAHRVSCGLLRPACQRMGCGMPHFPPCHAGAAGRVRPLNVEQRGLRQDTAVLARFRLAPLDLELCIMLLRFWRQVLSETGRRTMLLAKVFRQCQWFDPVITESGMHASGAHPWLRTLGEDMRPSSGWMFASSGTTRCWCKFRRLGMARARRTTHLFPPCPKTPNKPSSLQSARARHVAAHYPPTLACACTSCRRTRKSARRAESSAHNNAQGLVAHMRRCTSRRGIVRAPSWQESAPCWPEAATRGRRRRHLLCAAKLVSWQSFRAHLAIIHVIAVEVQGEL